MTIEHEFTSFPVCPHCGSVDPDAWEYEAEAINDEVVEVSCGVCGKDMRCVPHVTVLWTTSKVQEDDDNEQDDV